MTSRPRRISSPPSEPRAGGAIQHLVADADHHATQDGGVHSGLQFHAVAARHRDDPLPHLLQPLSVQLHRGGDHGAQDSPLLVREFADVGRDVHDREGVSAAGDVTRGGHLVASVLVEG